MSFNKKVQEFILYPWLSIWYAPRKTLKRCLKSNNIFVILLLLLFSVKMNLDNLELYHLEQYGYIAQIVVSFLMTLFAIAFIYFLVKIFKGTISKKEVLLIYLLANVPYLIFYIYRFFDYASNFLLLFDWLVALFCMIWSVYIMMQMLIEVASISKWKSTIIIFLAFIINMVIIEIPAYLAYVSNPFI